MKTNQFRIVDCHMHVIERLRGFSLKGEMRAIGNGRVRWANGDCNDILIDDYGSDSFTIEKLIAEMDAHGIQKGILLQGGFYGFQNEYTYEAQEKYPERLFGTGTLDPYCTESPKILRRLTDDFKFRALKFEISSFSGLMGYHPDFKLNGKIIKPVFDYAAERGIVISLDMGTFGNQSFQINELKEVANKYKNMKFVIEHLFAPAADRDADVKKNMQILADTGNVYFTLAAIPWNTRPEPYPFTSACRYLKIAKETVGVERIMWGSDIPAAIIGHPYVQLIEYVNESGIFNDAELQQVYASTTEKVYGI